MKRKIYFFISALIMIGSSLKAILYMDELVNTMIESFGDIPGNLGERVVNLFQNSGHIYITVLSLVTIVLNALILYWAYKDKLVKNKGKVIAFSIICIFMAAYAINELMAIINIIVISLAKRVNKEDYPDKKEKLPILKREEVTSKKIVYAIILLAIYFSQFIWESMIPNEPMITLLVSILFYVGMIILSLVFFWDLLSANFKVLKKNLKAYVQNVLPMIGKFYLIYLGISLIVFSIAGNNISANQSSVEELPIFVLFPLAVIYAPIVEECLFRGCLRRFIKNDKIFIVVSALVFGLLHTIFSEASIYTALVMAIPYATLGGFLAYLYVKTNNMFCNMSFHALQNLLATIMTMLINGL